MSGRVRSLNDRPGDGHAARDRHRQHDRARHRLGAERAGAGPARGRERDLDRRARPRRRAVEGTGRPQATFNRGVTIYPALGDRVRVASKAELELAFCGDTRTSVRVGCIRQDRSIPAMVRVDDLLGKHFAILGTTGTGKSCTTALILRSILEKNPAAHIVLLDPHNEYATAFGEWAEVISPRNMQLPYWLLTFEELVEVLIGDRGAQGRDRDPAGADPDRQEPLQRRAATRDNDKLRRGVLDTGRYTVDTPVPYRISDLISLIDERMGKLENKRDLAPYRNLKNRIDDDLPGPALRLHVRLADRLRRHGADPRPHLPRARQRQADHHPRADRPADRDRQRRRLGALPHDVRLRAVERGPGAGDAGLRGSAPLRAGQRRRSASSRASAPSPRSPRKAASTAPRCASSRSARPRSTRPSCPSATPCSRCACRTTATRRSSSRPSSDTGSGLLEFLPALGQREAIAFGDGVSLPVRIKFDELPKHCAAALARRRASPRSGRSRSATRASSSRSSSAGARPASASATGRRQPWPMMAEARRAAQLRRRRRRRPRCGIRARRLRRRRRTARSRATRQHGYARQRPAAPSLRREPAAPRRHVASAAAGLRAAKPGSASVARATRGAGRLPARRTQIPASLRDRLMRPAHDVDKRHRIVYAQSMPAPSALTTVGAPSVRVRERIILSS